jgi:hypothetical protein
VEVTCSGDPAKFRSGIYELGGGTKTLDFGTITLSTP